MSGLLAPLERLQALLAMHSGPRILGFYIGRDVADQMRATLAMSRASTDASAFGLPVLIDPEPIVPRLCLAVYDEAIWKRLVDGLKREG